MISILYGDNLELMKSMKLESIDLIYIDPPFNTGKQRILNRIKTSQGIDGDRVGFGAKRYITTKAGSISFDDIFISSKEYFDFLIPRLELSYSLLKTHGSFFFHIDYREAHYCKVALDSIFGRECFQNEIIWAYDFGGRSKKKWPAKHDSIFWYTKDPKNYTFNYDAIDRIPYMAPALAGKEKAKRGKIPTDFWWCTIVPTNSKERTGYPTQKPLKILERIVKVHSNPDDNCLDFFAGSGSFGEACNKHNRHCVLIDNNKDAIRIMNNRLKKIKLL